MSLRRREFLAGLGGAAALQSHGAYGQAPKLPVIGFLSDGPPRLLATYITAFRDGIIALGYVEGRNMAITYRSAQGNSDQLGTLADDLVRSQVQLIVASGGVVSAKAATKATASIPIFIRKRFRPCRPRPRRQPQQARRQCHRRESVLSGIGTKTSGVAVWIRFSNPQSRRSA